MWTVSLAFATFGCGGDDPQSTCTALSGSSWVPDISGATSDNHYANASGASNITVSKSVVTASGPLTGLAQPAGGSSEISVSIDMTDDLGALGSVTLTAETTDFPGDLQGSAYPILVYLSDGVNDFINLARAGTGSDCAASGYYSCSNGVCTENTNCRVSWPSAYVDRTHWEQHQVPTFGYASVNTFPNCRWTEGSVPSTSYPICPFSSGGSYTGFFPTSQSPSGSVPRLRYGTTYTAKYVLLASRYATLNGYNAGLKVTVVKKKDASTMAQTKRGAIDLNVVLVGSANIAASRTAKGQQNLNTLFKSVHDYFNQQVGGSSTTGIKLGSVRVIEWACEQGGDSYATVGATKLGTMFSAGSSILPAEYETKALNLFVVSKIEDDTSANSSLTILGLSGAIGGPPINGTSSSGLAFSSFNKLDSYNPNCSTSPCAITVQESAFVEIGATIAHEIGHYLGLNHPSESDGRTHDLVYDTPVCTATQSVGGTGYLTISSCLNSDTNSYSPTSLTCSAACTGYNSSSGVFCPTKLECQFNHMMWWTSKNFKEGTGTGDGDIFSNNVGTVMNFNPFVY